MQKCKHLRRSQKCTERATGKCDPRLKSPGRKVVGIGRYCSDQYRPLCVWGNLCNFVCQKKATRYIQVKLSTYYKENKEEKNMQVTATVKIMGEEASGISAQTGNPWKSRMILLE